MPVNTPRIIIFGIDCTPLFATIRSMERFIIVKGEPASKANSRRLITIGGKPRFIKSSKALSYADAFNLQVSKVEPLLIDELSVYMWIYYVTQRPDLDESLILDLLQGKIYVNDRQVRERHIYHYIDKDNPRVEIYVKSREKEEGLALLDAIKDSQRKERS
jgi:Holliday junction resolvase RusA-like endonuclease